MCLSPEPLERLVVFDRDNAHLCYAFTDKKHIHRAPKTTGFPIVGRLAKVGVRVLGSCRDTIRAITQAGGIFIITTFRGKSDVVAAIYRAASHCHDNCDHQPHRSLRSAKVVDAMYRRCAIALRLAWEEALIAGHTHERPASRIVIAGVAALIADRVIAAGGADSHFPGRKAGAAPRALGPSFAVVARHAGIPKRPPGDCVAAWCAAEGA